MYNFEQATSKAKQYVVNQGFFFVTLIEAKVEGQKWVVTYRDIPLFGKEKYTIELDKETGQVLSYRRYQ